MKLKAVRLVRLVAYATVLTLCIASFALVVDQLDRGPFCALDRDFTNTTTCGYTLAANVILFLAQLPLDALFVAALFFGWFERSVRGWEIALNAFGSLWSFIAATVVSARAGRQRPAAASAVLAFQWVDFVLISTCLLLVCFVDMGVSDDFDVTATATAVGVAPPPMHAAPPMGGGVVGYGQPAYGSRPRQRQPLSQPPPPSTFYGSPAYIGGSGGGTAVY